LDIDIKLKHWGASQAKFTPAAAPVLEFDGFGVS
jgi:hypothetical protein